MIPDPEITRLAEYLQDVIKDQSKLRRLVELQGHDAQVWLDRMQQLVDSPTTSPKLRSSIFTVMLRLSKNSGLHPHCLSIQNVKRLGEYPIASGGFGDVWKGAIGESQPVCLKIVKLYLGSDVEKLSKEYLREAIVWRQMKHPNLLPFLGIYRIEHTQQLCLISPWMDKGNLIQFVRCTPREDVNHFTLAHDIASGLRHLHDMNVVHGDLKGVNILMTPDGRACIGDFGLSRVANSLKLTTTTSAGPIGTARWLAPELLTGGGSTTKESDIYAYGCVCYEIFTGLQPFSEISQDAAVVLQVILGVRMKRPSNASELTDAMWAIMGSCWNAQPHARPRADEVLARLQTETKPPPTDAPDWAESLSKHILSNVDQSRIPDGPPLPDDRDSMSVYDGSSIKGIYSGIQAPPPLPPPSPARSVDSSPLFDRSNEDDSDSPPSSNHSSPYEIRIEKPDSPGSPFLSPATARPLPASPTTHAEGDKPRAVRPIILTDGNILSPNHGEPSASSALHGVDSRKRHWEASYGTLTSGEMSPSNFGLGRTCRTVNLESPKGPRPPNTSSRTASPGGTSSHVSPGSDVKTASTSGDSDTLPQKHVPSGVVVNVALIPDTAPSNVRERVRNLHYAGKRHAEHMVKAISAFTTGSTPPYSPATGVTDERFDEIVSEGLRIRDDIAFQQGRKDQAHTMIEKIWLIEADNALKEALREYEDLAQAAARCRAHLKRKEQASDEETVDRLYKECQTGRENAALLTRALIRVGPAALNTRDNSVVQDLYSTSTLSLELISQQIPWAISRAELAMAERKLDDLDDGEAAEAENLLNNLLFAQEVLKEALEQYEELGVS